MTRNALRRGFTLVELLVTLILLGLLTAIVFPIVVQQIDDAEPTKMANDLANIRTGAEVFHLNVRPRWAGDIEDLVHKVEAAEDDDITGTVYSTPNINNWNGPYIDAALTEDADGTAGTTGQQTGNAILTGFSLQIQNQFVCYSASANTFVVVTGAQTCTAGTHFVALLIGGATITTATPGTEFNAIDKLLDNSDGVAAGKIRAAEADGLVLDATGDSEYIVYLVAPYTN